MIIKKASKTEAGRKLSIKYNLEGTITIQNFYKQFLQSGCTNRNVLSNYGVSSKQSER